MALGTLIIQDKRRFSNREMVEQITKKTYLQYFIGLREDQPPFDPSLMVHLRKRFDADRKPNMKMVSDTTYLWTGSHYPQQVTAACGRSEAEILDFMC